MVHKPQISENSNRIKPNLGANHILEIGPSSHSCLVTSSDLETEAVLELKLQMVAGTGSD